MIEVALGIQFIAIVLKTFAIMSYMCSVTHFLLLWSVQIGDALNVDGLPVFLEAETYEQAG